MRSSSLLEDRTGAAFSGKYKSLFLGNQGTKQERLAALMDAIAEVYASVFGPDPIEYRAERGLLDVHEEMGILIQEVVGQRAGRYFLPAWSGVAFSNNEFRWSPRIRREDGLIRLVPGLGTRAVDRVGDDYPGADRAGPAESARQRDGRRGAASTRRSRWTSSTSRATRFETVERRRSSCAIRGEAYPQLRQLVSIVDDDRLRLPIGARVDSGIAINSSSRSRA